MAAPLTEERGDLLWKRMSVGRLAAGAAQNWALMRTGWKGRTAHLLSGVPTVTDSRI